jgi:hypothetical protein
MLLTKVKSTGLWDAACVGKVWPQSFFGLVPCFSLGARSRGAVSNVGHATL